MHRFNVGQQVIIRRNDPSAFCWTARRRKMMSRPMTEVYPSLDRYVVVFSWGEKQTFYEPQLEMVKDKSDAL